MKIKNTLVATALAATVLETGVVTPAPAFAYQRYYATADGLALRSGPGTTYSVLQRVNKGTPLDATCASHGTSVNGHDVWLKLTGSQWVSDTYTTSDGNWNRYPSGMPDCGRSGSTSSRAQRAVAWFQARNGSTAYEGLCEKAAETSYGVSGRYPSAKAAWQDAVRRGVARTSGTPTKGSLLFWAAGNPYYHTGVAVGDGTFYATSVRGAIGHARLPYYSGWLGWVPAGVLY